jgi:hypothetical protein
MTRETHLTVEIDGDCPLTDLDYFNMRNQELRQKYLIIAGKAYIIQKKVGKETGLGFFEEDVNTVNFNSVNSYRVIPPEIIEEERKGYGKRVTGGYVWRKGYGVEIAKENPFLIELSRKIGHPVYVISEVIHIDDGKFKICINGQCPILKIIGMPTLVPATQMYQELAYFVGNTLKPVPDADPPVEVSNIQKILKAGFDLKRSFRHRV